MSQIGSVNINFNLPANQTNYVGLPKTLVAGVSQRGPIYKVVKITDINKFIIVFGQPTNQYEFDFFQSMKSVVDNGGIAFCLRIPYTDDKQLDKAIFNYYVIGSDEDEVVYDVKYSQEPIPDYLAKLSFTPINDFNSVLKFNEVDDTTEISVDRICFNTKVDIDPSQIIGVFPIVFASKDAENLRNLNFSDVYPYSESTDDYIDMFNVYACDGMSPYSKSTSEIFNAFNEFERSTHFKQNWMETELSKLIDEYVPQDTSTCKNTIGVMFAAYYLDDEHKLDYKILESYYGLIGCSNSTFRDIEDLVNYNSCFFRLEVDNPVDEKKYLRALKIESGRWLIPMVSPVAASKRHLIDMSSIFSNSPPVKYNKKYNQSLSRLLKKLNKTDFQNSVPFDYFVPSGLQDIILQKEYRENQEEEYINERKTDSIVDYFEYRVDLDSDNSVEITKVGELFEDEDQYENVKSLYRLLTFGTSIGDKGAISIIDVPRIFNDYFIKHVDRYSTEIDIKNTIKVLDKIFPTLVGSREMYDRTYPIFNYQYVDKDARLTRFHKFRPLRKFEIVPGSSMLVGAYMYETFLNSFDPIAGQRIKDLLYPCHHCYVNMIQPNLFKVMFDVYGVSSLINDRDNNTFPIQQTTWRNTTSILKQIHAFRIYVAIRRMTYEIAKSYLYELNHQLNRNNLLSALNYLLNQFKEQNYIDNNSNVDVWADLADIEQHQVQVVLTVGIYGAIVKIIVNMNLQNMSIEVIQ